MRPPAWPAAWLPRRSVRLRLTLLYGGLFLVSGMVLLAVTYLLVTSKIFGAEAVFEISAKSPGTVPAGAGAAGPASHFSQGGGGRDQVGQLLVLCGVALGVMLAVSVAAGWLMAGRVLRPLRAITATTRQLSAQSLHRRLAAAGPDDELKDLADTIDGLLARLDAAFDAQADALDAQRRFVANASHELRGPLTRQRALVEVALADPDASAASLRATFGRVLAAGKQQERLIQALLALARGQAGLDRTEPFDLAAVAQEVLLARHAELRRRRLRLKAALAATPALGDPRLAERLVGNLLDNAIGHNLPADGWVQVQTSTAAGRAELAVANSGPAVPPAELDRLLRPFQRGGSDRTGHRGGHGLGLSIVAAVAAAHHADLHVDARGDGGLKVVVGFPTPDTPHHTTAAAGAATQAKPPGHDPPAAAPLPTPPTPPRDRTRS